MQLTRLPFDAPLHEYDQQASAVFDGWRARDAAVMTFIRRHHPRFLDADVPWLPKRMSVDAMEREPFEADDARLAVARWYVFRDWQALEEYVRAVMQPGSPVATFEAAVEAVINGDAAALDALLRDHPDLVQTRSTRVTPHDPPRHRATPLHYIAANGIEGYRERTPSNAVEIAAMLLRTGAEPDALADMYGGQCTALSMLVSSGIPRRAGLQIALAELLIDHGAAVDGVGAGAWTSPLMTALAFGYLDTAQAIVGRGARVDALPAAAGLGRVDDVRQMLSSATSEDRHRALALAAQLGHAAVAALLLDAGESPDRYNPKHNHGHSTPLHQAALAGHESVVRLLVERGARLDIRDTIWDGTPLGWAMHGGRTAIADYLRSHGGDD